MGGRARKRQKKLPWKLRRIRDAFEASQNQLIRLLGLEKQIEQTYISAYERGQLEPPLYILLKYADLANVCLEILVRDEHDLPADIPAKEKFFSH